MCRVSNSCRRPWKMLSVILDTLECLRQLGIFCIHEVIMDHCCSILWFSTSISVCISIHHSRPGRLQMCASSIPNCPPSASLQSSRAVHSGKEDRPQSAFIPLCSQCNIFLRNDFRWILFPAASSSPGGRTSFALSFCTSARPGMWPCC